MKPKLTSLGVLFLFFSIFNYSYGQTIAVSGKVNNSTGEPLTGATVTVKGTSQATTTDSQGNFSINVPQKGAVLVITNVGMKPEQYTVKSNAPVSITMETTRGTLEEVVLNVGYGSQKKSVNTGSISSIRSRDLEKVPNGTIATALQGRAAGVFVAANSGQPGSLSTIRIRGITTFGTGGNDPLFVIDGIPVDNGAINFLNQSDIESIEVLKDATAASIYGTRAAKGVILVTTKKGKSGKLTVGYNGFFGTSAPATRLDLLNATQYAVLMNEKSVAAGGSILFPDISTIGKGTDWQNEIFNNQAHRFSHEVNVSGGNERSTFYLSLGWQNQEGIVSTSISNYERKNIRINSTHKISKVFTFGQTIGYAHQETRGIGNTNSEYGGPLSSAINLDPITPAVVTDTAIANAAPYSVNPVIRDANGNPYGISTLVGQEMTNPKAYERTRYGGYSWSDDFVGNAFLEINITKNIKIRSNIGGKLAYWGNQGFTPVFYLSPTVSVLKNNYGKATNNTFNWTVENYITYDQKFGDHHINAVAGQGAYVENNGGSSAVTLFDLPITSFEEASFNFDIPQANRTSGSSDFVKHKLSSIFGRLNYDYKEKYLLTSTIRRDGSTRFGLNNKYGYFPSFSLGWVVTKEDFFTPNRFVRSLKVRGGYGRVGNDGIGDFGYVSRVQGGFNYTLGNTGAITTGYSPVTLSNPDLKWEEVRATDVGIDAQVFNDFMVTFNFYDRKTVGILREVRVPGYVGVSSSPLGNVASMKNSGFEVELGYQKKLGPVSFSANGNFSTLKNKVTYVALTPISLVEMQAFNQWEL